MKFLLWFQIDPDFYEGNEKIDLSDYVPNMDWDVIDTSAKRYEKYYPCCSEPYPDLKFNLTIARKTSLYSVIMVTPYIFLALLSPIVFLFPFNETQRFSLGKKYYYILHGKLD